MSCKSCFSSDTPNIVLKSLFAKYDTNGDGQLKAQELVTLMKEDLGLDDEASNAYALLIDKDGSGAVSAEEFFAWLKSGDNLSLVNDSSKYHRFIKAVDMYNKFDVDRSGNIDRNEFEKLFSSLDGKPENLDSALIALDKDGNGVISFSEFLRWLNWIPLENF